MRKYGIVLGVLLLAMSACSTSSNDIEMKLSKQEVSETQNSEIQQLNLEELFNKITDNESFIVMISQSTCSYCNSFKKTLHPFLRVHSNIPFFEVEVDMQVDKKADIAKSFDELHTHIPEFSGGTPELLFFDHGSVKQQASGELSEIALRNFMIDCGYIKGEKQEEVNLDFTLHESAYVMSSDFMEVAKNIEEGNDFYVVIAQADRFNAIYSETLVEVMEDVKQVVHLLDVSKQPQVMSQEEMDQIDNASLTVSNVLSDYQFSPTLYHIKDGVILDQLVDNCSDEELRIWFQKQQ